MRAGGEVIESPERRRRIAARGYLPGSGRSGRIFPRICFLLYAVDAKAVCLVEIRTSVAVAVRQRSLDRIEAAVSRVAPED